MPSTLKDVAHNVGLSTTSVSLVLNGRPNKLSEQSRQRIREEALRLDYHIPARQRRHPIAVGLIVPHISDSFFADVIQGVYDCLEKNNGQLLLAINDDLPEKDVESIRRLSAKGISALLIVASTACSQNAFANLKMPVIQVDRQSPALQFTSVLLNHKKGGFLATKHLLDLGHRRIACISGPLNAQSAQMRIEGYLWAYKNAGLTPPPNGIFEGDYNNRSGYSAVDRILSDGFTAAFACNDMMAIGIYQHMRELKRRIPEDLSIVGFDDIPSANLLDVPLTTIRQSGYDLGFVSCQRALQEISDNTLTKQTIQFEPELIIRQSTCALQQNC